MPKISSYPDGGAVQATDQFVVARAGHNKSILGSNVGGGGSGGSPSVCDGRLTLTTGVPVTIADVTAATTLYFTPYVGSKIGLYNGSSWDIVDFTQLSLSLSGYTANKNYDIWVYNNSGTATLESTIWTDDTNRATAIVRQNGIFCKTGALTRRYVGTIRITGTTGQCEDSIKDRFVWNYYNRVIKDLVAMDTTDSWNYTTATWRAANNNTTDGVGRVACVIGVSEDPIDARRPFAVRNSTGNVFVSGGIGIDSTTTDSCQFKCSVWCQAAPLIQSSLLTAYLAAGYHYIQSLEWSTASGTTTWSGDEGTTSLQTGLLVKIKA